MTWVGQTLLLLLVTASLVLFVGVGWERLWFHRWWFQARKAWWRVRYTIHRIADQPYYRDDD